MPTAAARILEDARPARQRRVGSKEYAMAVITPLRDAPPAADGARAREDAPDNRGTVVFFRIEDDGVLRLIGIAPMPAGPDAASAEAASPIRPS